MEEKELLTGLLSRAYGMDETGVASLYNEDGSALNDNALDTLLDLDKARIATAKGDSKKRFDDGYKKAQKEVLGSFEKEIQEKFAIDVDKQGLELIEAIIETKTAGKGTKEVTPEDIQKSRVYLDAIEAKDRQISETIEEWKGKLESFQADVQREKTFSVVGAKAVEILDSLNPILSENPEIARNQRNILLNELQGQQFDIREDRIVVLDENGDDAVDGHGQRIDFNALVKSTAQKYYDFKAADDRRGAGGKGGGRGAGGDLTVDSEQDFIKKMQNAKTSEEKIALTEAYQALQS